MVYWLIYLQPTSNSFYFGLYTYFLLVLSTIYVISPIRPVHRLTQNLIRRLLINIISGCLGMLMKNSFAHSMHPGSDFPPDFSPYHLTIAASWTFRFRWVLIVIFTYGCIIYTCMTDLNGTKLAYSSNGRFFRNLQERNTYHLVFYRAEKTPVKSSEYILLWNKPSRQ